MSNQAIGDVFGEAIALGQVGWIELAQGHTAAVRVAFVQSLPMHAEAWAEFDQIRLLVAFGEQAVADGDAARAARLFGFVASQAILLGEQQTIVANQIEVLAGHMTAAQLNLALVEGRALLLAQAIAVALHE